MSNTSLLFFVPLRLCFAFLLVYEDGWGAIFALGVRWSLSMSIYRTRSFLSRGLYTFLPHFQRPFMYCVTFGLMYGWYSRAASNQERPMKVYFFDSNLKSNTQIIWLKKTFASRWIYCTRATMTRSWLKTALED